MSENGSGNRIPEREEDNTTYESFDYFQNEH